MTALRTCTTLVRDLGRDESGVTVVEFALIAPTFLLLLLGTLDIGQMVYAQSVLNGAVQTAARDASLEGGDTAAADAMVLEQISGVMPGVELNTSRTSYYDFADIERAEQWNDADDNGICNDGEAMRVVRHPIPPQRASQIRAALIRCVAKANAQRVVLARVLLL